jgi:hypothetical protein
MDPKEVFDRRAKRGVGPMEPASKAPGPFDSVAESLFERVPLPIMDPLPRVLEFQRKTDSWFGFPYHCLMNLQYRPHDHLILTFSTHEVVVLGRNLKRLYEDVVSQKCASIVEMDRATALATSDDAFEVHRIQVEELGRAPRAKREGAKPSPGP